MNVEDLVGVRVWMKRDQFRSVSGVISGVPNAVNRDNLQSSIKESTFRIDMPSGDTIQVPGLIFPSLITTAACARRYRPFVKMRRTMRQ
jgi:hypothetical protein